MLNKFFFYIVLNLFFFISISFGFNIDSLISEGIKKIYDVKFKEAQLIFDNLKQYPQYDIEYNFFSTMIIWWRIQIEPRNRQFDSLFLQKAEYTIKLCDKKLEINGSNDKIYFYKGGLLGFVGRLHVFRKEWLKAALAGKDALPILKKAYKLNKNNTDLYLGFGIYDYYAQAIPDKYPFLKPFMVFFDKGDKKRGIKELELVEKKGKFAKYEAMYQLLMIYFIFEKNGRKSYEYSLKLHQLFPDNPIFQRYLGRSLILIGQISRAEKVYKNVIKKHEVNFLGYHKEAAQEAYYYLGYIAYLRQQYSKMEQYFKKVMDVEKSLKLEKKSGYYVYAIFYRARSYHKQGNVGLAEKYYKEVLSLPDYNGSRKKAREYLSHLK